MAMVNKGKAHMIPLAKPLIGQEEINAVVAVLQSGQLAQGSVVHEFERAFANYIGTEHAVATSNGTTALHVALLAHGIGEGDEVITSPFTFIASANSILHTGARPVFVDIEPDTFNIDVESLEAAITPRTRAIMPVHLYGNPADMKRIMEIAGKHNLAVIEDCAQAHGAKAYGQTVGSFGTGCFSFYPTKNMTSGEGGMVTTNDADTADTSVLLREHGARKRYQHEMLAYNFRMTNIHAAIGIAQMSKIQGWTEARRANAARLSEMLDGLVATPVVRDWAEHVYHQYTIRISGGRGDVPARLAELGVGVGVHYPIPVHKQPLYQDLGYTDSLPVSERAAEEVISLPVHPSLTDEDLVTIADAIKQVIA